MSASVAAQFLTEQFRDRSLHPSAGAVMGLPEQLAQSGLMGGSVYDALVAITVAEADGLLHTFDARASRTYETVGVRARRPGQPE